MLKPSSVHVEQLTLSTTAGPELSTRAATLAPVGRAIDIWSFGCVLSLAATWIVLGTDGINQFQILRERATTKTTTENGLITTLASGAFHDGNGLLEEVYDWHRYIRSAVRQSDKVTVHMLDIVERDMLQSDPSERSSAVDVRDRMRQLLFSTRGTTVSPTSRRVLDALAQYNTELGGANLAQGQKHFGILKLDPHLGQHHPFGGSDNDDTRGEQLKTYEYKRLSSSTNIRLLKLYGARSENEGIVCELVEESLRDQEPVDFEALSWSWGMGPWTDKIKIRQGDEVFGHKVPPDLGKALRALRLRQTVRTLWVDALCIDQNRMEERNQQVPSMPLIFGTARKVCVWIGDANEDSEIAIRFIKEEVLKLQAFDELRESQEVTPKWTAMLNLMKRPWFERRKSSCA
jgi:serine/threonine protein kinase